MPISASFLLFALSVSSLSILLRPLLKKEKLKPWLLVAIIFVGTIVMFNSTYLTCADGWRSNSIGSRGACSWHGGVVEDFNDFGWAVLIGTLFILFSFFIVSLIKGILIGGNKTELSNPTTRNIKINNFKIDRDGKCPHCNINLIFEDSDIEKKVVVCPNNDCRGKFIIRPVWKGGKRGGAVIKTKKI